MLTPIPIPRIPAPSVEQFYSSYVSANQPVVITGLADAWPAMKNWDLSYFSNKFGQVKASTIPIKDGRCYADTETGVDIKSVPIQQSIELIESGETYDSRAITSPIDVFPLSFQEDYITPLYCANGTYLNSRIWISPKGTVTPLHQDLPENLYVLVKGEKKIILFPPSAPVYCHSRFSKIPNMAKVDPEAPDYMMYPRFNEAQPYITQLKAGETLYIPGLWWHHLSNSESSIAINFWWSQGWKTALSWAARQYKKIRNVGNGDSD